MKNCRLVQKQLTAYLHHELEPQKLQSMEEHLAGCEACRVELEAQRVTLSLLGEALEAAPAPTELPAWSVIPRRAPVRRPVDRRMFKIRLVSLAVTGCFAALLFMFTGSYVVFSVVQKPDLAFSAPVSFVPAPLDMALKRPEAKLKKLQAPVAVKKNRWSELQTKPSLSLGDAAMLDVAGMGSSVGGGIGAFNLVVPEGMMNSESERDSLSRLGAEIEGNEVLGSRSFVVSHREDRSQIAAATESKPAEEWGDVDGSSFYKGDRVEVEAIFKELPGPIVTDEIINGYAVLNSLTDGNDENGVGAKDKQAVQEQVYSRDYEDMDADGLDNYWEFAEPDADGLSDDYMREESGLSARQLQRLRPVNTRKPQLRPAVFNPYVMTADNAFSTFAIDVDTASYGLARARLAGRQIPEPESVRTEEFVNSFDYDYRPPAGEQTFAVHSEMAPSPFRMSMEALKIGVKGRRIGRDDHRGAVLTLVIDTSGSMSTPERLGLIKESLGLLIDQLAPEDEVAIVQFGNGARLVCEHTPVRQKSALLHAVDSLQAGGPTQFDLGLQLGYEQAMAGFRAGDSNRILILSDGVANVGELDPDAILNQVAALRKKGVYLSVLGFGAGTYDDDLLERLADRGDGMYVYIDTMEEAHRLFVDQLASTLHVIASDVKIQVEFNPNRVLRYRQLGYENRQLTKEQFRDDTVDAGEVGSGQSVTALYDVELIPDGPAYEPIATVYVRYRRADNGAIEEISSRVTDGACATRFEEADSRFKVAVCAAEFAEYLRRSPYADGTDIREIADQMLPAVQALDLDGEVATLHELISIVDKLER